MQQTQVIMCTFRPSNLQSYTSSRDKYKQSVTGQNLNKNTICLTKSENGMPKCPTKNHVASLFDTFNLFIGHMHCIPTRCKAMPYHKPLCSNTLETQFKSVIFVSAPLPARTWQCPFLHETWSAVWPWASYGTQHKWQNNAALSHNMLNIV